MFWVCCIYPGYYTWLPCVTNRERLCERETTKCRTKKNIIGTQLHFYSTQTRMFCITTKVFSYITYREMYVLYKSYFYSDKSNSSFTLTKAIGRECCAFTVQLRLRWRWLMLFRSITSYNIMIIYVCGA